MYLDSGICLLTTQFTIFVWAAIKTEACSVFLLFIPCLLYEKNVLENQIFGMEISHDLFS